MRLERGVGARVLQGFGVHMVKCGLYSPRKGIEGMIWPNFHFLKRYHSSSFWRLD